MTSLLGNSAGAENLKPDMKALKKMRKSSADSSMFVTKMPAHRSATHFPGNRLLLWVGIIIAMVTRAGWFVSMRIHNSTIVHRYDDCSNNLKFRHFVKSIAVFQNFEFREWKTTQWVTAVTQRLRREFSIISTTRSSPHPTQRTFTRRIVSRSLALRQFTSTQCTSPCSRSSITNRGIAMRIRKTLCLTSRISAQRSRHTSSQ